MLNLDRRHLFVAVALLLALLVLSAFAHYAAQERVIRSAQRVADVQQRQALISSLMQTVLNAETGQRGFLLTGKDSFLEPYRAALANLQPAVAALRAAGTGEPDYDTTVAELEGVIGERVSALQKSIQLLDTSRAAAAEYVRSGVDQMLMNEIRASTNELLEKDTRLLATLQQTARHDLLLMRVINVTATLLDVLLLLLAAALLNRDIRRRAAEAQRLQAERNELERQVALRTADLAALSSHLQHVSEQEKSSLARELHDELGSLLVAAKMDIAWLRRRVASEDGDSRTRWERVLSVLDAGIDFKRRIVEKLRPSLLDNMGLFAALRWQLQEICGSAGLKLRDELPADELALHQDAAIALFRIVQEATTNIIKHAHATTVTVRATVADGRLVVSIGDDGVGMGAGASAGPGMHGLRSMRHRIESLGGTWQVHSSATTHGTLISVELPLSRILETDAAA